MAKSKKSVAVPRSQSQIVAQAERAAEEGAIKAVLIFFDPEGRVGMTSTEETSAFEAVFLLRQAEHMIFLPDAEEEDEDF